jgi:ABC-type multidrug transport system permease subunit
MAAGAVMLFVFGILLLIGVPILTGIFIKLFRRSSGVSNDAPFYKQPAIFIPSLLIAIVLMLVFCYFIVPVIFDALFSSFGAYN